MKSKRRRRIRKMTSERVLMDGYGRSTISLRNGFQDGVKAFTIHML